MSEDAKGDVGGTGKGNGAPRRWVWFLLGLATPVLVSAAVWLAWYGKVHQGAKAKLERAENGERKLVLDLKTCEDSNSFSETRAKRYRRKYKKRMRRLKKALRTIVRLGRLEGVHAIAARVVAATKGRAWGYVDERGRVVIPGRFLGAAPFSAGRAAVNVNGKYGYVNARGKLVIPARFDGADAFVALVKAAPATDVGSKIGGARSVVRALAVVEVKERFGVIDQDGKTVVKPECGRVRVHPAGLIQCWPPRKGRKRKRSRRKVSRALYRADGSLVIRGRMHRLNRLAYDRLAVRKGKRWGYVDSRGKWVIPAKLKRARAFREGIARVRTGKRWGHIDRQGKLLGRGKWLNAKDFVNGRAAVSGDRGWGFIDRTGKVVVPLRYEAVHSFGARDGLAPAKKGRLWGFIDGQGRWVVKPRYKVAKPFAHGLSLVDEAERFYHCVTSKGTIAGRPGRIVPDPKAPQPYQEAGKWGFRDVGNAVIVTPRYQWAGKFYEGRARVRVDGKWGYVDLTGKLVIPAKHFRARAFAEGRAAVWVGPADTGAYALIDPSGKVVVPARYHWVGRFVGGFALASIDGADALIDRQGRAFLLGYGGIGCTPAAKSRNVGINPTELFVDAWERPVPPPPIERKGRKSRRRSAPVVTIAAPTAALQPRKKDGRYGYVDRAGKWVIPPTFERAGPFRQGRAPVLLGRAK